VAGALGATTPARGGDALGVSGLVVSGSEAYAPYVDQGRWPAWSPEVPPDRLPVLEEPYRRALLEGRAAAVCDLAAESPAQRYGRACARIAVGREVEARADLESALPHLGDLCRVELAFLDLRQRSAVRDALETARAIAARAGADAPLRARALHVAGLAEGKLRKTPAALATLLEACELYRAEGDRFGQARVHDTLGMLHAARGRLDHAVYCYALSLVDKSLLGDRHGMAITLGNLGRVHLRAGRFRDALECFARDLALAEDLGDLRGQARMHEDVGRAHAGLEDDGAAERSYRACVEMATRLRFPDLAFFAHKDLCDLRLRQGDLAGAARELATAAATRPEGGEEYLGLILEAARGALQEAKGEPEAIATLEKAVEGFVAADLPDLEIPARILLARALLRQRLKATAERCLVEGVRRARTAGYARYLTILNEALGGLGLVEGALETEARPVAEAGASVGGGAYVLRQRLGAGRFGEVFRAYDPERAREVALKRIHLGRLYDVEQRRWLLQSARVELEAASRVRHPGVVRVFALASDEEGDVQVVQEFVAGRPLRALMDPEARTSLADVLRCLSAIASALHALHEVGVVHRDLKPENVIVRPDGTPVLVDFGIAHVVESDVPEDPDLVAGTLEYMAPEQAEGRKVDGRADLYALGVLAFEWLAGVRPLHPRGKSLREAARYLATQAAPPLADFRPGLPEALSSLVASMLEKKPKRRPRDAEDVARRLEALAASAGS
jgi:serine/threonine-protein kinase